MVEKIKAKQYIDENGCYCVKCIVCGKVLKFKTDHIEYNMSCPCGAWIEVE